MVPDTRGGMYHVSHHDVVPCTDYPNYIQLSKHVIYNMISHEITLNKNTKNGLHKTKQDKGYHQIKFLPSTFPISSLHNTGVLSLAEIGPK